MYELTIESNGKKIVKTAKTKGELRRLVYVYSVGNSHVLDGIAEELSKAKEIKETFDTAKEPTKKAKKETEITEETK